MLAFTGLLCLALDFGETLSNRNNVCMVAKKDSTTSPSGQENGSSSNRLGLWTRSKQTKNQAKST